MYKKENVRQDGHVNNIDLIFKGLHTFLGIKCETFFVVKLKRNLNQKSFFLCFECKIVWERLFIDFGNKNRLNFIWFHRTFLNVISSTKCENDWYFLTFAINHSPQGHFFCWQSFSAHLSISLPQNILFILNKKWNTIKKYLKKY